MIKHYEKLLGGDRKKNDRRMKKEGFDDGIFDLLENIETKVKKGYNKNEYKDRSLKKDNYG